MSHEARVRASKTAAWSCGAAKDGSPRRQPWVQAVQVRSRGAAKETSNPVIVCHDYSFSGTLSNSTAKY